MSDRSQNTEAVASTDLNTGPTPGLASQDENTPLLSNEVSGDGTTSSSQTVPYKNVDGKQFWPLFSCICIAYILGSADMTLMSTTHPTITSYFQSSNAASWLSTVFYLASTVTIPIYGRASDAVGRRKVYLFAISLFALTTTWCALAQSIESLILARMACGLGAGGLTAMSNVIVSDIIKIEYRGIYQSYLNLAFGFGNGLGVVAGGILCDHLGWRSIFYFQLPVILVLVLMAFSFVPANLGPNLMAAQGKGYRLAFETFDAKGAAILTVNVSGLILGANLGGNVFPWTHPIVISSLAVFVVTSLLLIVVERKAVRPVLPLKLLASIPLGNLMWSNFFGLLVSNTMFFNIPVLLQTVWQLSPSTSGVILIAPLIFVTACSFFTGYYIMRTRRLKPMLVVGLVLSLLGTGLIAVSTLPGLPLWSVVVLVPWSNTAQGFFAPATTVAVLALSSTDEQAVVTTTLSLMRQLGSIMGVAISSLVLQNALIPYLRKEVLASPEMKRHIIDVVRKSIRSIGQLEEPYKHQVLSAYAKALRVTFLSAAVFALLALGLVVWLRLPRVQSDEGND